MKSFLVGIKNVLLWSHARGTWQYDVLCGLIVLTLLLWPGQSSKRAAASGQPGQAKAAQVGASTAGVWEHEIEWLQLRAFLQEQNKMELLNSPREAVVFYLQAEMKTAVILVSLEPFGDAQGRSGYRVRYNSN